MTATRADILTMEAHQEKVRKLLESAEGESDAWWDVWETDTETQTAGAVATARELYTRWVDTGPRGKKGWALAGKTNEGRPYSVRDWMEHGDEIGAAAAYAAKQHYEAGAWSVLSESTSATVDEVAEVAEKAADALETAAEAVAKPWPLPVKVALWGGGLALGVAAIGYGVRPFLGVKVRQ